LAARRRRGRSRQTAPYSWANPLPLRMEECESLQYNEHNALRLLGHFGLSLRWNKWDIERHPPFETFCRGVIACACPIEMQRDRELRRMFPPQALAGITGPPPQWRAPA
jgi:hypothetical protein